MNDHGIAHEHARVVAMLAENLERVTKRLSAYVAAHGPLSDREDETFGMAAIALDMARGGTNPLIDGNGGFSKSLVIVPLDDDERAFSDTSLPDDMVAAGMDVLERVDDDLNEYVSTVTPDWDDGMAAVAVYRAMVRAARLRPFFCRHATDATGRWTETRATDHDDAARVFARSQFDDSQGEWMGGTLHVIEDPDHPLARHASYDVDMVFDDTPEGTLRAIVTKLPEESAALTADADVSGTPE